MVHFKHISQSTCSDDGLWLTERDWGFAVFEFSYWEDLDPSAVPTYGKYNVQAGVVQVDNVEDNTNALKSCGWEIDAEGNIWCPYSGDIIVEKSSPYFNYCLVECLWRYGCKDVIQDESGNNRSKLIKSARNCLV